MQGKKRARRLHNNVEKKYRANISERLLELRNAVPALRADCFADNLHGLQPADRVNKASILAKATEYIKHLENTNTYLLNELYRVQQQAQLPPTFPQQYLQYFENNHQNRPHEMTPNSSSFNSVNDQYISGSYDYQQQPQQLPQLQQDTREYPQYQDSPSYQLYNFSTFPTTQAYPDSPYRINVAEAYPDQPPSLSGDFSHRMLVGGVSGPVGS